MANQSLPVFSLTKEITEADFRAAVDPLLVNGIPVDQWSRDIIHMMSILVKTFLSGIRILTSVADAQERDLLLNAMIVRKVLVGIKCVTPLQLLHGCDFLKKKPGQDLVRQLRLKRKLEGRITGAHTVEEMGLFSVFEAQWRVLAAQVKELRRKLAFNRSEADCQVEKIRAEFFPAGAYMEMHGNVVEEDAVLLFLSDDPARIAGLKTFLEDRIACCPRKESERFRILMSVVFGSDVALPVPACEAAPCAGKEKHPFEKDSTEVDPEVEGAAEHNVAVEKGRRNLRPRPVSQPQADSSRHPQRHRLK